MASVSEYRPKFVQVSNIHARVTVKWPFDVPPTCLIPKRSAQVGSPSNRHKNATRLFLFLCLIVVIFKLGARLWPSPISKANTAI